MKIGDKVRTLRTLRGISQEKAAELLDMSVTGYQKIERGEVDVPYSRLEKIVKALNSSVLELVSIGEKNIYYVHGNSENNQVGGFIVNNNNFAQDEILKRLERLEKAFQEK